MATTREMLAYVPAELAFGTSGLRGLVTDMTDLECYINAAGFIRFLEQADRLPKQSDIYVAGDLRKSTPRILRAVHQAIEDCGHRTVYCGLIPTPALAYYAQQKGAACIMVTGSHIPDDRNGIKFYKTGGEVLKEDELAIHEAVAAVRAKVYAKPSADFTPDGMCVQPATLPPETPVAAQAYIRRYTEVFDGKALAGKKIVFYQHSSVGRDILPRIFEALGATVERVGFSDDFVPLESENVTPDDQAYFKVLAKQHPDAFAILSADGDADRPFVVDEQGVFHRGDVLGAIVADWLQADYAAFPVSASDAVDKHLAEHKVKWQHTKIGSPYVIVSMNEALHAGFKRVVGWEVNGGLLLGSNVTMNGKTLEALPTRDAFLPMLGALLMAAKVGSVSKMFTVFPPRFSQQGLIDNFPPSTYKAIIEHYLPDTPETRKKLGAYFTAKNGFGAITRINGLDGVRIYFDNGDIAHIRLSSNAPQLRMYSVADSQERADTIVALAIAEPDGIFRRIERAITAV